MIDEPVDPRVSLYRHGYTYWTGDTAQYYAFPVYARTNVPLHHIPGRRYVIKIHKRAWRVMHTQWGSGALTESISVWTSPTLRTYAAAKAVALMQVRMDA